MGRHLPEEEPVPGQLVRGDMGLGMNRKHYGALKTIRRGILRLIGALLMGVWRGISGVFRRVRERNTRPNS